MVKSVYTEDISQRQLEKLRADGVRPTSNISVQEQSEENQRELEDIIENDREEVSGDPTTEQTPGKRRRKSKKDADATDGNSAFTVTVKKVKMQVPNFRVHYVVCDEAQYLKNPQSITNKLVDTFDRDFILFVTATALLNSIRDMHGYLSLIWRREWSFNYTEDDPIEATHFYDDQVWQDMHTGVLPDG